MGADLYIEQIHQPLFDKYQPMFEAAVRQRDRLPRGSQEAEAAQALVEKYYDRMYADGYFRDSYNVTGVLRQLGLSWWRDVIPLCTQAHKLRQDKLRQFRRRVANAPLHLPTLEELKQEHAMVTESGEDSVEAWHRYYRERRDQLLAFLDQAIALNTHIRCSL
jgi:hypothetical protein